jgi:hypothetical protein
MSLQSLLHEPAVSEGTTSFSALCGLRELASFSVIVVSGALSISGTSSAEPTKVWEAPYVHEPVATRMVVSDLRRISGLTWEQLVHQLAQPGLARW